MSRDQRTKDILKAVKEHQEQVKINKLMRHITMAMNEKNYLASLNLKYVGDKPIDEIFFTFINEAQLLNENNFDKVLELFVNHLQQDNLVSLVNGNEER